MEKVLSAMITDFGGGGVLCRREREGVTREVDQKEDAHRGQDK